MARNEEATIAGVIRSVLPFAQETIVVDGNSTDNTRDIAQSLGVKVFQDNGRGKGDGVRKAIEVAEGDVIVFFDADGSHDAGDITALASPILAGEADLVVASRWKGGSDELGGDWSMFVRSTGSAFIAMLINSRWGVHLTDCENGFRAISRKAARSIGLVEDGFTIEQEMVMKCLKHGFRVSEVPSHEYVRQAGESQIKVWKVLHTFAWNLVKNLF
ncbi:MAG: glycosyltransferase family 2 protein [Thermoleophilia bacterium]